MDALFEACPRSQSLQRNAHRADSPRPTILGGQPRAKANEEEWSTFNLKTAHSQYNQGNETKGEQNSRRKRKRTEQISLRTATTTKWENRKIHLNLVGALIPYSMIKRVDVTFYFGHDMVPPNHDEYRPVGYCLHSKSHTHHDKLTTGLAACLGRSSAQEHISNSQM